MLERVGVDRCAGPRRPSAAAAAGSATSDRRRRCPSSVTPRRRRALRRRALRGRNEQRAQPGEAVAIDAAAHDELGERVLELGRQQPHGVGDLVEERSAVRGQMLGDQRCAREPRPASSPPAGAMRVQSAAARRGSSRTGVERSDVPPRCGRRRRPGAGGSTASGRPCTGRRARDWRSPARAPAGSRPPRPPPALRSLRAGRARRRARRGR